MSKVRKVLKVKTKFASKLTLYRLSTLWTLRTRRLRFASCYSNVVDTLNR